jgi:hypothetical protein
MDPQSLPQQTRYSYKWARSVVEDLYRKCPRVSNLVEPILGLTRNQMAFVLAARQTEWQILRGFVVQSEHYAAKQTAVGRNTPQTLSICCQVALERAIKRAPDSLRGYLQQRKRSIYSKSWEKTEAGSSARSGVEAGGQLLLFPEA